MEFVIRPPDEATMAELEAEVEEVAREYEGPRRLCPCGKMFTPYRSFQHYHSDACRVKFEKGRPSSYTKRPFVMVKCKQCGTEFRTNDGKQHYCSHECYVKHETERHVEPETRRCLNCEKEFTTSHWMKRYCGDQCRKEARWKHH